MKLHVKHINDCRAEQLLRKCTRNKDDLVLRNVQDLVPNAAEIILLFPRYAKLQEQQQHLPTYDTTAFSLSETKCKGKGKQLFKKNKLQRCKSTVKVFARGKNTVIKAKLINTLNPFFIQSF